MSSNYYEQGGAKNRSAIETIITALKSVSTIGRALDVGCGNGGVLEALGREGAALFGVDASQAAIELTRVRVPAATLATADVQNKLPFSGAFFDCVLMLDVLEHLECPVAALREIRRVMRPGGVVAITTPNANSPLRWIRGAKWFGVMDPGHVLLYSHFTLVHLLRKCGFEIMLDRIEAFTGTALDPVARRFRIGGTLYVVGKKVE